MAKLMLFVFVTLLAVSCIMATERCGRHGDPCVSDSNCCANIKCHRYANRCQVQITEEELMAQREKILGRRGKDY
ncbi:PREDICTED: omega-conotoxin-like protein 1 [Dinoponera quadriceps]|uniref:Omega-conotoxin-like protein 1 n=1 Tax=Dinoponera quadriceps TaxID=609295 RepID=A0A6P3X9Y5_DINQU|nr:PREDICTED: omega-conotoxin-like protein 1 [Dinoponera quadriceps]XP_014475206.1 PREDICTED: omega-conotoxin-like protein 1 [Dinoponera quadriceps]